MFRLIPRSERQQHAEEPDVGLKAEAELRATDVKQLLVNQDNVLSEQWNLSLEQEVQTQPPHIQEEQEEQRNRREGEQLEEEGVTFVKSEEHECSDVQQLMVTDEEVPSAEQENPELLHIKEEQEEPWSSQSESVCGLNPESSHVAEASEPQLVLNSLRITEVPAADVRGKKTCSCSECGEMFVHSPNLKIHMRTHTGERPFGCPVCGKSFTQKVNLMYHMSDIKFTLTPVAVKSEEDEETPQSSQLHQSPTVENRADCGGPEPARDSGPDGPLQPGPEDKTEDSSKFKSKAFDKKLKQRNEPCLNLVNDSGCNAVPNSFSCSQCGKVFGRKEHLQTHVRIHTGERPFVCSECGKTFGCKRSLLGHMTSHTGERPFSCSRCGKRFGRMVNLKTHERLHTGERPFTCPFCGKGFTQKVHMTQHMAVHTGEKQFSCSVCEKQFTWLSGFRRHKCGGERSEQDRTGESSEVELGHKAFLCRECGNRFNHKHNLKAHMRIHTGEKPFGCSVCSKGFIASGALKKHLRTHSGEKPFSCPVCAVRFTQGGNLKRHLAQHVGAAREKPFSCSVCGKSFTQVSNMKRHMMQHDGNETSGSPEVGGEIRREHHGTAVDDHVT